MTSPYRAGSSPRRPRRPGCSASVLDGTPRVARRPTPEAITPIKTGPLSRPEYDTAAIRPMLRPARSGSSRAAAVTICGKIPARPRPSRAKPAMPAAWRADQQPGRQAEAGHQAAGADQAHRAEPGGQPVAGHPPGRHRDRERAERHGGGSGRRAQVDVHVDGAPVAGGALAHLPAQREQAEHPDHGRDLASRTARQVIGVLLAGRDGGDEYVRRGHQAQHDQRDGGHRDLAGAQPSRDPAPIPRRPARRCCSPRPART